MIGMESRTACFTGHRELPADDLPEISKRLKDTHSSSTITRLFNDYDGTERHNPRKKTRNPATELLCSGVHLCAETVEKPDFKRFLGMKKAHDNSIKITVHWWLRRRDLNPRPSGYEHLFALIVSSRILQKTLENTDFFASLLFAF